MKYALFAFLVLVALINVNELTSLRNVQEQSLGYRLLSLLLIAFCAVMAGWVWTLPCG